MRAGNYPTLSMSTLAMLETLYFRVTGTYGASLYNAYSYLLKTLGGGVDDDDDDDDEDDDAEIDDDSAGLTSTLNRPLVSTLMDTAMTPDRTSVFHSQATFLAEIETRTSGTRAVKVADTGSATPGRKRGVSSRAAKKAYAAAVAFSNPDTMCRELAAALEVLMVHATISALLPAKTVSDVASGMVEEAQEKKKSSKRAHDHFVYPTWIKPTMSKARALDRFLDEILDNMPRARWYEPDPNDSVLSNFNGDLVDNWDPPVPVGTKYTTACPPTTVPVVSTKLYVFPTPSRLSHIIIGGHTRLLDHLDLDLDGLDTIKGYTGLATPFVAVCVFRKSTLNRPMHNVLLNAPEYADQSLLPKLPKLAMQLSVGKTRGGSKAVLVDKKLCDEDTCELPPVRVVNFAIPFDHLNKHYLLRTNIRQKSKMCEYETIRVLNNKSHAEKKKEAYVLTGRPRYTKLTANAFGLKEFEMDVACGSKSEAIETGGYADDAQSDVDTTTAAATVAFGGLTVGDNPPLSLLSNTTTMTTTTITTTTTNKNKVMDIVVSAPWQQPPKRRRLKRMSEVEATSSDHTIPPLTHVDVESMGVDAFMELGNSLLNPPDLIIPDSAQHSDSEMLCTPQPKSRGCNKRRGRKREVSGTSNVHEDLATVSEVEAETEADGSSISDDDDDDDDGGVGGSDMGF
ncbi:hypothetical protein SARC_02965 [Sphaeroforma arctica JP610]|uniref:Uncharacterized protein n=1 Tax=Sphaeroforma arctica JP610 TaxID=667725 RepID=A0A0L0G7C6_9EUKA|nr:hypothetical protein SARC_02965 [Sphaeroforma arctica JP610]KNC84824.1 hypothetical protein SARC_02965 [Sphaeroforma arctica JP610]|eukprot:XP_014158726.1 hypothetical protein SARC_02965 [Sphaeroforma arctica JP610]